MRIGCQTLFVLAAGLFAAAQTQAIQISSAGQRWTVDWSIGLDAAGTLNATSNWLVNSFTPAQIMLDLYISNTSSLTGQLTHADITSFGFGVEPNATGSILMAGTTFSKADTGSGPKQTFPGGFKGIDVCLFNQGCSGGSVNQALHAGASDHLTLLLTGNFSNSVVELLDFPIKFQTNLGSYHAGGCVNKDPSCSPVPEPPISALLGMGLLLIILSQPGLRRITGPNPQH